MQSVDSARIRYGAKRAPSLPGPVQEVKPLDLRAEQQVPTAPPITPDRSGEYPSPLVSLRSRDAQSDFITSFFDEEEAAVGSVPPKTGSCFIDSWVLRQCMLADATRDIRYSRLLSGLIHSTKFSTTSFYATSSKKLERFCQIEPVLLVSPTISSGLNVFVHSFTRIPDTVTIIRRNTEYFAKPFGPSMPRGTLNVVTLPKCYATGIPVQFQTAKVRAFCYARIHMIQMPRGDLVDELWIIDKGLPFKSPFTIQRAVSDDLDLETRAKQVIELVKQSGNDCQFSKWF